MQMETSNIIIILLTFDSVRRRVRKKFQQLNVSIEQRLLFIRICTTFLFVFVRQTVVQQTKNVLL